MSALADPFEARRVAGATGLLREFNEIGVLSAADVHVAARMAELVGEESESVRLAVALAVRGPRLGHVFVDLATIPRHRHRRIGRARRSVRAVLAGEEEWLGALERSELVAAGEDDAGPGEARPLRLLGSRLYLDRYWREERAVAADLNEMTANGRLEVIAGGPGTGKTTQVARMVAELLEGDATTAAGRTCGADRQGGGAASGGSARRGSRAQRQRGDPRPDVGAAVLDAASIARVAPAEPQPVRARPRQPLAA